MSSNDVRSKTTNGFGKKQHKPGQRVNWTAELDSLNPRQVDTASFLTRAIKKCVRCGVAPKMESFICFVF